MNKEIIFMLTSILWVVIYSRIESQRKIFDILFSVIKLVIILTALIAMHANNYIADPIISLIIIFVFFILIFIIAPRRIAEKIIKIKESNE